MASTTRSSALLLLALLPACLPDTDMSLIDCRADLALAKQKRDAGAPTEAASCDLESGAFAAAHGDGAPVPFGIALNVDREQTSAFVEAQCRGAGSTDCVRRALTAVRLSCPGAVGQACLVRAKEAMAR
jgi:hypothetical protein